MGFDVVDDRLSVVAAHAEHDRQSSRVGFQDGVHHQFLFSDSSGITFSLSPDTNSLTVQLKQDISLLDVHDFCETLRIFVQETADARIALFKEDDDENSIGANANNTSLLRA